MNTTIAITDGSGVQWQHRFRVANDGDDTWVSVTTNSPARDTIQDGAAGASIYTPQNSGTGTQFLTIDRDYLSFDLSAIPSNARISSIQVVLTASGTPTVVDVAAAVFRLVKATTDSSTANGATTGNAIDHTINSGEDITFPLAGAGTEFTFDLNGSSLFDFVVAQHEAGNRANFYKLSKLEYDVFVDGSAAGPTGTTRSPAHGAGATTESERPKMLVEWSYVGGGADYPVRYAKINGLSKADSDFFINGMKDIHVNGLRDPLEIVAVPGSSGTAATFLTKQVSWLGPTGKSGVGQVPSNWRTANGDTVFSSGGVVQLTTRGWSSDTGGTTGSSGTGPTRGHDSTQGIDGDGREGTSTDDFIYTEASSQFNKHFMLRTPELDLSTALANNTLKLYFWFHIYGSNVHSTAALGVAVTDSATSAADDTLSLHFTGLTTGGATITYWDDDSDDGSSTATGVRIGGQQQAYGHGSSEVGAHWRLGVVDLNSVAGQSSVYIWFYSKSGSSFRSDICLDDVSVVGEE